MKKNIFINNRRIELEPSQLIQSGGEGMVFGLGDTAVKLYHHPQPRHEAKLRALLDSGLAGRLPGHVLGPRALARNGRNQIIGFQMPRLPAASQPLKQLSNPAFWQKMNLRARDAAALLQHIHTTLTQLHHLGVIAGDLNDHNLYFTPSPPHPVTSSPCHPPTPSPPHPLALSSPHPVRLSSRRSLTSSWIDVDSYQYNGHPCPVAMPAFLDPTLYGVTDFSRRPVFTSLTDWYAFTVLLVKSLLQVHPYGGVHRRHKSLQARATAAVSILNSAVTYPQRARPRESLSDELLHQIHLIFDKGQRHPFPIQLLNQYAASLITCAQCGLSYPTSRPGCPACRQKTPASRRPAAANGLQKRLLLRVDGFIEHVAVLANGRILAITRENNSYKLVRLGIGGKLDEMMLFNGRAGYRFGIFGDHLVVNPPRKPQLLILDVGGRQPRSVTMIETALFRGSAVFAATPHHLYRIAGAWIMRGRVRDGLYLEDAIATAHRAQTQFWASPYHDAIAGFHRIFAEHRFFVIDANGAGYDVPLPPLAPGESIAETAVAFGPESVAFMLKIGGNGHFHTNIHISNYQGQQLHSLSQTADPSLMAQHYPYTTNPAHPSPPFIPHPSSPILEDDAILHAHPGGLLIQQPACLHLIP